MPHSCKNACTPDVLVDNMRVSVASSKDRVAPMRSSRNLEWLDAQLDAHRAEERAQLAAEARRASPTLTSADAKPAFQRSNECFWRGTRQETAGT